jgi:hypothetical protein
MFKLDFSPTFRAPVRFGVPGPDGTRQAAEFTGIFKRLTVDQSEALATEADAGKWSDRQMAERLLVGWGDEVTDRHGAPLPFTPANLADVFNVPNAAAAVLQAYRRAQQDAALGN